jgi:hypothetical protein
MLLCTKSISHHEEHEDHEGIPKHIIYFNFMAFMLFMVKKKLRFDDYLGSHLY